MFYSLFQFAFLVFFFFFFFSKIAVCTFQAFGPVIEKEKENTNFFDNFLYFNIKIFLKY